MDTEQVKPLVIGECPNCGSGDYQGSHVSIDGNKAFQGCYCPACDYQWNDIYTLTEQIEDK